MTAYDTDDRLYRRVPPQSVDLRHREVQRDPGQAPRGAGRGHPAPSSCGSYRRPLLSVKMSEFTRAGCRRSRHVGARRTRGQFELFLHAFDGTRGRAAAAGGGGARLLSATASSSASCVPAGPTSQELFCPGTILNPQRFERTEISVFTFGMAHKIRVPLYRRLRDLLEATGQTLFGLRLDGAAREHRASTTRSSCGSRSCSRSSTARSTSWATCRTRRSSTT